MLPELQDSQDPANLKSKLNKMRVMFLDRKLKDFNYELGEQIGYGRDGLVLSLKNNNDIVCKFCLNTTEALVANKIKSLSDITGLPKIYNVFRIEREITYFLIFIEKLFENEKFTASMYKLENLDLGSQKSLWFKKEIINKIKNEKILDIISDSNFIISAAGILRAAAIDDEFFSFINEYFKDSYSIQSLVNNLSIEQRMTLAEVCSDVLKEKNYNEEYFVFSFLISSIKNLRKIKINHLDIAARNIMQNKSGDLVLVDFGITSGDFKEIQDYQDL